MVIVCPECSTKFRVNSERIPDSGAKVRCARCKHVFLAQKPPEEIPAPVIETPAPPVAVPEPVASFEPVPTSEPETAEETDFDFGADIEEEEPLPSEPGPMATEDLELDEEPLDDDFGADKEEQDSGFSYDQFRELDPAPQTEEEEDFSFDSSPEIRESSDAEPVDEEEDNFSFSGPEDEPADQIKEAVEEAAEPVKKKKHTDEELTAMPADDPESETTAEEFSVPEQKKSSPLASLIRILLLLILGLLIIGGALYFLNGPEQIEQAIQQLLSQQVQPVEQGRITLSELEGKFINNQEAGELFVIRGVATNNYREPRASIQVKGIIFDQNGNQLLQKTIFCGNPISDQELQTLPFSKLEEMMRNQFGKAMNNMKVNNKESIPFVIAFHNLPQSLSEFSVDIASSEPAAQ